MKTARSTLINADGMMVSPSSDHPDDLAQRVIDILASDSTQTAEDESSVKCAIRRTGEYCETHAPNYSARPFFQGSHEQYRKRPVYWLLQSPKLTFNVYLFQERATDQTLALLQGKRYLGGESSRCGSN